MLLFVFTRLRVLVLEDEMNLLTLAMLNLDRLNRTYLISTTAFIRAKHDDIRGSVRELLEMKSLVLSEKL